MTKNDYTITGVVERIDDALMTLVVSPTLPKTCGSIAANRRNVGRWLNGIARLLEVGRLRKISPRMNDSENQEIIRINSIVDSVRQAAD